MHPEAPEHRPGAKGRRPLGLQKSLVALLLCGAIFAIYFQVRNHDFISYDDNLYVLENPSLRSGLSLDGVLWAFREPYETNWIPLTWISLQIDHACFGFEPAGYHLENVALHALSAVLLFLVLSHMTGSLWASAFVAAVFAVHPLHVESVAWVSERKDTLSGVFWMLTLGAYGFYARRPGSVIRYLLVAASLSLGLLAKPMLITLPFVLLLLDHWPLGRLARNGAGRRLDPVLVRRAALEKLPLFAIAAAVGVVTALVQRHAGAMSHDEMLPFPLRLINALDSYVMYAIDSFWPRGLAFFYPHPLGTSSPWIAAASGLGLAAVSVWVTRSAMSRPYLAVGWLWYLGTLIPVIGLVQVGMQARADRYTYISQIGLSIAVAWGAREALAHSRLGRIALAAAGSAAVVGLSVCAWLQVPYWRNSVALFSRAVDVTESNFVAHNGLGRELLAAGRPEEAEHHFARAVELKPRWADARIGLGAALAAQGRFDEAIERYRQALQLAPRNAVGHEHLGKALEDSGKLNKAIAHYRLAIRLYRNHPSAEVHAYLASALAQKGNLEEAREHYETAIALRPEFAEAHANLGFVLMRAERFAEARAEFERSLELAPESPDVHAGLAVAAERLGDPSAAIRHYRNALRMRPGWRYPANNLAWLLATHPNPKVRDPVEAVRISEELQRDAGARDPETLDTLAASYAAAGRFDDATRTAEAALGLASSNGLTPLAREIERRLALYREDRPFVDEASSPSR